MPSLPTPCLPPLPLQVDCHSEGIDFNEFIAAMFDSQDLASQQAALDNVVSLGGWRRGSLQYRQFQHARLKTTSVSGVVTAAVISM